MKKLKFKSIASQIIGCLLIMLLFTAIYLCGCEDNSENEQADYPVIGIWHAQTKQKQDNPYNYGGDIIVTDYYFEFAENGIIKNRGIVTLNNRLLSDTGWIIANATWSINKNIITFSNGRKFVITDDEFDDIYNNMVLRYYKE